MNKWISVKKKMPDKDGRYLIVEYSPSNHPWVGISNLRNGKWDDQSTEFWMEIPEPPTQGNA